jgi:hypothetical protein
MLPLIATPKYDMIVPSTGESITYRPYVVKEEKILLIALESQDDIAIERSVTDIIKACIESPIDINKLTTFDIEFMFINLRSKSVGEGIRLNMKCDSEDCDATTEQKIDLGLVSVSNLEEKANNHIKLNADISIDLRWMSMNDKLTKAQRTTQTDTVINSVAKSIETVYSGEDIFAAKDVTHKELVSFVESLNTDQFAEIIKFMEAAPALSYTMKYNCTSCGHENTRELKGLADFFT